MEAAKKAGTAKAGQAAGTGGSKSGDKASTPSTDRGGRIGDGTFFVKKSQTAASAAGALAVAKSAKGKMIKTVSYCACVKQT